MEFTRLLQPNPKVVIDFFETPGIAQAYKEAKGESRDE